MTEPVTYTTDDEQLTLELDPDEETVSVHEAPDDPKNEPRSFVIASSRADLQEVIDLLLWVAKDWDTHLRGEPIPMDDEEDEEDEEEEEDDEEASS